MGFTGAKKKVTSRMCIQANVSRSQQTCGKPVFPLVIRLHRASRYGTWGEIEWLNLLSLFLIMTSNGQASDEFYPPCEQSIKHRFQLRIDASYPGNDLRSPVEIRLFTLH